MKKLEWVKPALRDLGTALTDGHAVFGECNTGAIYNENCGNGTDAVTKCNAGNVNLACGAGGANP